MITDEQAGSLSGTWKILLDCNAEIPSSANEISQTSRTIWEMVKLEKDAIAQSYELAVEVKQYGLESHEILKELAGIKDRLANLYVKTSLAIQAATSR